MTPETEGSSVTRPEIGAGFAGIFELLEAPDYRLAQHGPHTPGEIPVDIDLILYADDVQSTFVEFGTTVLPH
jgi:hypothetical protein